MFKQYMEASDFGRPTTSLEISGENLEDLLAYDDLFLDYFNAFLALPVFPQPLVYNRLTGAFEEVDEGTPELTGAYPALNLASLHYGPTDIEREKMLWWARKERLPLFIKTQLFRELKLVKLLLRPLEDRQSASRGSSRNVRGYSRQTETYVSSLSNSVDNSGHDVLDDDDLWGDFNYSALYRYQRPGSRALSVPIKCIHDDMMEYEEDDDYYYMTVQSSTSIKKEKRVASSGAKSAGKRTSTEKKAARVSSRVEVIPPAVKSSKTRSSQRTIGPPASSTEEAFKRGARALSAPVNYSQFMNMPPLDLPDFDQMFGEDEPENTGQAYVTFEDDHVSDEQTESDVKNMEGRFKMSVQQMKEHILCSRPGFEEFREFLQGTSSGLVLLDFWLDCENFKDTMEYFDENKQREIATMLYRDIQDKYKLRLTQDAKEQITRSTSNMALSHTIFLRTQYDVLRRLRAYWLPRYLTHCERTNTIELEPKAQEPLTARQLKPLRPTRPQVAMFPSISLVHSMPVLPEEARNFNFSSNSGVDGRGGMTRAFSSLSLRSSFSNRSHRNRFRRTVTSASLSTCSRSTSSRQTICSRSTKDRFLLSLEQDRIAGGPFQNYLSKRLGDEQLLSCLLFWQDVTEYGATEDRSADRLLRMCHAWSIYNKYLSTDSRHKVEISEKERLNLHKTLSSAHNFIEASIFDTAKMQAVTRLEKAWVRFLKEDLKAFLDCRIRVGGESPPSTADAIQITVTDQEVLIKRPRPWVRRVPGSAASERAKRLQKALILAEDIDDERRAEKKREALEKRKEMERERRKAIKAAYARQKEAQKKKVGVQSAKTEKSGGAEGGEGEGADAVDGEEKEKKSVTYQDLSSNRQVMSMFRKYLTEQDSTKEVQNLMHFNQEIETYFGAKDTKQKKDTMASHIFKTYLEPQAKKFTQTNERIVQRLSAEKERPKTGTLRELQRFVLSKVEETFKEFLARQSEEFGINPADLASMSQAELAMRMGSDQALFAGWQKAGNKGQSRGKNKEAEKKRKEEEEKEKEERDARNKIATMHFTSVKIHVFEDGHDGRSTKRPRGQGGQKGQDGKAVLSRTDSYSRRKGKSRRPNAIETIPEIQETEADAKGESQGTPTGGLTSGGGDGAPSRGPKDTPTTPLPAFRRGRRGKTTGRSQPVREDKNEFLNALGQSAAGQPTVPMLYFYKYLLKHGEEDGMPQLDKDLFFYIEVQKFKYCSHAFSDEEMMKRKVQSIVDCFLDSVYSPTLQIDISSEMHIKMMKASQRYLGGKEVLPSLFDEAQYYVFKELLPYWAGFRKSQQHPESPKKRPVTKYEKMLKKRLENIENYTIPSKDFHLPRIPEGAIPSYTISIFEGVKYREMSESAVPTPFPETKDHRSSRLTVARSSVESLSRKSRKLSVTKEALVSR
ncbi:regulator of G-protein signaling 22-like isoform X2 [Littorina saxatilis]|uniref:regulator of G-protein signaling 22-like isoform X2 n=1 Tax=Littorina saxatilis TaxID=31220 RepID=UPI0038B550B4